MEAFKEECIFGIPIRIKAIQFHTQHLVMLLWTEDEFGVETVLYDNGSGQALGAGSIVIHTKAK